jgi:hypothetical protein
MESNFTVLWIDDEHNDTKMLPFILEAEGEGLILEGYKSFEEGFDILEKNLNRYDAILLDGMFFEKKDQVSGTEDETGLGMAIAKLNELKARKFFPWFVLSGKVEFTKSNNSIIKANKARCFDKTNPKDVVDLFVTIKETTANQGDTKIKYKYNRVLQVCSDKYIGEKHFDRVLKLIKDLENNISTENPEDLLNPLRKIVEAIFSMLGKIGVIPDEILKSQGAINKSSLFLSSKHKEYKYNRVVVPPIIGENIYRLLNILQDASHAEGELKLRVDDYLKFSGSDYLYKSCILTTLDLLVWVRDFADKNPDKNTNLTFWSKVNKDTEWISGKVVQIAANGFGTFKSDVDLKTISITPKQIHEYVLKESDLIKVKAAPSPNGLKTYIKEVEKE